MAEKLEYRIWKRHNASNGEHIWRGNLHVADITGDGAREVSQIAVAFHNACISVNEANPIAVAEGLNLVIETLKNLIVRIDEGLALGEELDIAPARYALSAIEQGKGG